MEKGHKSKCIITILIVLILNIILLASFSPVGTVGLAISLTSSLILSEELKTTDDNKIRTSVQINTLQEMSCCDLSSDDLSTDIYSKGTFSKML